MNATALSFVLVAAVVHAAWNLAAKRVSGEGPRFVWSYYSVSAAAVLPFTAVAVATGQPRWTWLLTGLVTGVLHVVYGLVLQRGYREGDLSVVYPLARGTGPLLSVAVAVLVLGERPGVTGLLGAAAIVAGVFVIGTARPRDAADPVASRRAVRAGVGYGVLTGAAIAGYTVWDAYAVATLGVPPLVHFGIGCIAQSLLLAPHALQDRKRVVRLWQEHRAEVLLVGLLSPVAYLLVLYAMRLAPVSLVAPAREVSIVFGGLAAWLLLGEERAARRLVGSCVVLLGIVAIATA